MHGRCKPRFVRDDNELKDTGYKTLFKNGANISASCMLRSYTNRRRRSLFQERLQAI